MVGGLITLSGRQRQYTHSDQGRAEFGARCGFRRIILQALDRLIEGKTAIVIAHAPGPNRAISLLTALEVRISEPRLREEISGLAGGCS